MRSFCWGLVSQKKQTHKERCLVLEEVTALVSVCCKMPLDNDILMYQGENDAQGVWSYIP